MKSILAPTRPDLNMMGVAPAADNPGQSNAYMTEGKGNRHSDADQEALEGLNSCSTSERLLP